MSARKAKQGELSITRARSRNDVKGFPIVGIMPELLQRITPMTEVNNALLTALCLFILSNTLYSQSASIHSEFGITAGAFTNFPADSSYLKENINVFYLAPYVRTGRHEFSAGLLYQLAAHALYFTGNNVSPRLGATAGYKFYVFNVYGRENLFIHYSFQYLRFVGSYDIYDRWGNLLPVTETNTYINNVIGLGYNLYFDTNERFGFYYTLDWVISQTGYNLKSPHNNPNTWTTRYVWNNISTNFGFIFKIMSLKKRNKK